MTRTIEAIVEEQAHRWQLRRGDQGAEAHRPVITVSRLHGARGGEVARTLAAELGLDLFDREIIQRIAESTHLSERVVASLEADRDILSEWLASMATSNYLSPAEFRYHLSRVVGALAQHGGAVILGRAAHLVLGPGGALRVLVVAPLETRVRTIAERDGVDEREARRRIVAVEAERKAFLLRHFHADFADPATFDVVVNTAVLGVAGACAAIRTAVQKVPARPIVERVAR